MMTFVSLAVKSSKKVVEERQGEKRLISFSLLANHGRVTLVLYRMRPALMQIPPELRSGAFDTAVCRKPLAVAADAGFPMGFQSIFAWEALPEAAFVKEAVLDAHRSKHESIASGWLHRSARPILPQASPVWKVWNLPDCFLRARESVRRSSGFVQTGFSEVGHFKSTCPQRAENFNPEAKPNGDMYRGP